MPILRIQGGLFRLSLDVVPMDVHARWRDEPILLRQLWRSNEAMHHLRLTPAPANAAAILHAPAQALRLREPARVL